MKTKMLYEYDKVTRELKGASPATPDANWPGGYAPRMYATDIEPPKGSGKHEVAVFDEDKKVWNVEADFRGTTYYIRNDEGVIEAVTIKDIGVTVPENGYLNHGDVPLTDKEKKDKEIAQIKGRLAEIDVESVRPLRAVTSGDASDFDTNKLDQLDKEAAALRGRLSDLT